MVRLILVFLLAGCNLAQSASALQPEQVFSKAAPSVTMVFAKDGKAIFQGSGVVVGPEKVVTNCHVVLNKGGVALHGLAIRHQGQSFPAKFLTGDTEYDTCLLAVSGLRGNPVKIADPSSLRVGQRVYAIGAPSGLDLTLTDGLISSLRAVGRTHIVQTSAPISPGSSGGGLFNENGELIGITSFGIGSGTGLNFAYQADRILSLVSIAKTMGDSYEPLASSVQAALTTATADRAAPEPRFPSIPGKIDWLTEMSTRLSLRMPDREKRLDFLKTVYYEAKRAGLDPQLVLALIDNVSGFRKYEVSASGARGYMQVMPHWVTLIGTKDSNLFHLRTNLRFGCTILRHYLDMENGDLYRALAFYVSDMKGRGTPTFSGNEVAQLNKIRNSWETQWIWTSD